MNNNRTELLLREPFITDRIASSDGENKMITFAQGGFNNFGALSPFIITDLKVGPDGYLYVLAVIPGIFQGKYLGLFQNEQLTTRLTVYN